MIQINQISKSFGEIKALNQVSCRIGEGRIFGLFGTNGAGKSTLLRIMAGILEPDRGTVLLDGEEIAGRMDLKRRIFYLPDQPYYFPAATLEEMALFYARQYKKMDIDSVRYMAGKLELDMLRPVRTFSKGMKRQAFLIMGLCAQTDYLLCDEVFDGLDPVVTEAMKKLFEEEMAERRLTVVMAAHKLQDLEGFCREVAILHKGGLLLAGDMEKKASDIHKIQCVTERDIEEELRGRLKILRYQREGYFTTLIVRGEREEILRAAKESAPLFCREVTMTLEEIFIVEMEAAEYDIHQALR